MHSNVSCEASYVAELESMFYANDEIGRVHADSPFLNSWRTVQLHV